jgi:acyl CoA:acetate/3-ketoacid CoA transferase beta subunit
VTEISRDEYCVIACAEAWRGAGEVLASPFGYIPTAGARLAKATFEPDLIITDGEAVAVSNTLPLGSTETVAEGWFPFRFVFDLLAHGARHVMMGAVQVDRYGNQNISCVGDHAQPTVQLIGCRGAPGNTISHDTSYWIPNHSPRVFVERVDFVSGVGHDKDPPGHPRFVVSNLGVFDFETPDHSMRIRTLHPGVSVDEVRDNTGFELIVPDDVPSTRDATDEELQILREVIDRGDLRKTEIRA